MVKPGKNLGKSVDDGGERMVYPHVAVCQKGGYAKGRVLAGALGRGRDGGEFIHCLIIIELFCSGVE